MRHFIPIVNGIKLLLPAALDGCKSLWPCTTIIDNRDSHCELEVDLSLFAQGIDVYTPPIPMNTAQTMNFMLRFSAQKRLPYFTWQHLDAVCLDRTDVLLPAYARDLLERGIMWGALLTRSKLKKPRTIEGRTFTSIATDAFAAYNTSALLSVGGWDSLRFPFYALDSDLHIRLEREGFSVINTQFPVDHVNFSRTLKFDPERERIVELHWPLWKKLFSDKHGSAIWEYETFE